MSEKENWKWQKELLIKRDKEHQQKIESLQEENKELKDQLHQKDKVIKDFFIKISKVTRENVIAGNNTIDLDELLEILDKGE